MATVLWAVKGPRLIRLLRHENFQGRNYEPNILESAGDKFMRALQTCWSISWWTSPVIMTVLYKRGYCTQEGMVQIGKILLSLGIIYVGSFCLRGLGRLLNPDYMMFVNILVQTMASPSIPNKRLLGNYDFEFWAWPVDFKWNDSSESKGERVGRTKVHLQYDHGMHFTGISAIPSRILSYFAINTFGRRMVYPGTTSVMQLLVGGMLNQGRATLIEEKNGLRAKVLTEDNNEIDTMFIDKRKPGSRKGNTLVVCFEGNAGFYEMGCSGTPIECGYSVLGWNHPGFAGSTGVPFPEAEQNAIDAVMQYAINALGFQPDNIILFAWSIGGYGATWAAMNYPDVKHVILDATFDDVVPLALTQMPAAWANLVSLALRNYMDLNVAEQLLKYPGPVKLIRRVRDEIISTEKNDRMQPLLSSNRGNDLLIRLLQYRYPNIVDASTLQLLSEYLKKPRQLQEVMMMEHQVNMDECDATVRSYIQEESPVYPLLLGQQYSQNKKNQMTLFLAYKYMEDYDSSHCTPLPARFIDEPWNPHS